MVQILEPMHTSGPVETVVTAGVPLAPISIRVGFSSRAFHVKARAFAWPLTTAATRSAGSRAVETYSFTKAGARTRNRQQAISICQHRLGPAGTVPRYGIASMVHSHAKACCWAGNGFQNAGAVDTCRTGPGRSCPGKFITGVIYSDTEAGTCTRNRLDAVTIHA